MPHPLPTASFLKWADPASIGNGDCMKEIPFLTLQRDIFDPLAPEIPTLFIALEDDAYTLTKKK